MVLNQQGREIFSPDPTHPGEMLADELEARDLTIEHLAEWARLTPAFVRSFINGKQPATPALANRLSEVLDIDASFWLNAQANYERCLAHHASKRGKKP